MPEHPTNASQELGADSPFSVDTRGEFSFPENHRYDAGYGLTEATIDYKDIRHKDNTPPDSVARRNYNLTASFSLQCDNSAYTNDAKRFDSLRTAPLTDAEEYIYKKYKSRMDSLRPAKRTDRERTRRRDFWRVRQLRLRRSDILRDIQPE